MEDLVYEARNGNDEAFSELMMSISDDLYKIARIRINNEEDINDAIQETMISVYKSLNKLDDYKKFKFWVIKILVNKCNRIYRKKSKSEKSLEECAINEFIIENSCNDIENNLNFFWSSKDLTNEARLIRQRY